MKTQLTSKNAFRRIADTVLKASTADDTFVGFSDSQASTLRFANNQVVQHVSVREPSLSVRVAFGQKVGRATTNRFDDESLRSTVQRAERIARVTPADPEFLPSLPPQDYMQVDTYRDSTANATPTSQAKRTAPVIARCERDGLIAAGTMTNSTSVRGLAASSGLFAFGRSTSGTFSLTATGEDSTGWAMNTHRDIDKLDVRAMTESSVQKALRSAKPREVPAGHHTVILEPSATTGIFGPVLWSLDAKSYYKGTSALVGKLGTAVLDTRLSLRTHPDHRDLLGSAFAGDGMATRPQTWFDRGVLSQLYYDRFTAKEKGHEPNSWPRATELTFDGPVVKSVDDLVKETEKGILITNFWYIRFVNPRDLTLTGMTRDGTFLVENGEIVGGVRNFRFHESPLRVFQNVLAATDPKEAISLERGKAMLPAVKLADFNLSSVTKF